MDFPTLSDLLRHLYTPYSKLLFTTMGRDSTGVEYTYSINMEETSVGFQPGSGGR